MTAQILDTQVSLDGLLEVLGKNLYSTPAVAIRELIQNAHDACTRRTLEQPDHNQNFEITLTTDSSNTSLTIQDNGSGLTKQEIIDYLATVGSGYTRVLRDANHNEQMIGYFGLGFLSAYVVADKVDVWTTSYQEPNQTWHFSSRGGKRYSIQSAETRAVGTKVKLQLKNEFLPLGDPQVLDSLVSKYCCLLPTKIYLNQHSEALNQLTPPWQLPAEVSSLQRQKKQLAFAAIFENQFEPICTIPITANNAAQLEGLIWIQDAGGFSTSDFRNVNVFIRNMHISQKERDLLPRWAGFIGCIIHSTELVPTASREDIQQDEHYHLAQQVIAESLIEGLKHIALNDKATWRRIISRHDQALLGASIADDSLFELLNDQLKVPTNYGNITLAQIVKRSNGKIYLRHEDKISYEDILFKAKDIPVVSGFMFAAAQFCYKYAEINRINVIEVGKKSDDKQIFTTVDTPIDTQEWLKQLLNQDGDEMYFAQFDPIELPMVIVEDSDTKLKNRIEQDEKDKRIGAAALMLAKLHTNKIDGQIKQRLYINMSCPLIQQLIELQQQPEKAQTLAQLLRSFMLIMAHDGQDQQLDFSAELTQFSQSLQQLI